MVKAYFEDNYTMCIGQAATALKNLSTSVVVLSRSELLDRARTPIDQATS